MPCTPAGPIPPATPLVGSSGRVPVRRLSMLALSAAALSLVAAACGSAGPRGLPATSTAGGAATTVATVATVAAPSPAAQTATTAAPQPAHLVAQAEVPSVSVFAQPAAGEPVRTLDNPRPLGTQLVFLVQQRMDDWLEVLVPVRPNGTTGWIRAADVSLVAHDYRIVVELGAHLITVYNGETVFHQEKVGLGRGTTPTPGGLFYTLELFEVDPSQPYYGPYAYGLSGFSEVLFNFAGGDGQFAIHGTDDPASLGRSVSNGCIRMSNEGITKLAFTLPPGVPVEIRA